MHAWRKIAISGVVMAMYVALTVLLHPISYGIIQVRFSTGLYALAAFQPGLALPLGLANGLANYFGGLGPVDIGVGTLVGALTAWWVSRIRTPVLQPLPIVLVPTAIVPIYLSALLKAPYLVTVASVGLGQLIAAYTVGWGLLRLGSRLRPLFADPDRGGTLNG